MLCHSFACVWSLSVCSLHPHVARCVTCLIQGSGIGEGGCQNVNECTANSSLYLVNCSAAATCIDLVGSYTCQCNPGYVGDGFQCTDVDGELWDDWACGRPLVLFSCCSSFSAMARLQLLRPAVSLWLTPSLLECGQGLFECSPRSSGCINVPGSYTCGPCVRGYQGDGKLCTPTGSITIASSSLSQGAFVGSTVEIVLLSRADGPATVRVSVFGLPASRYNLSSLEPGGLISGNVVQFEASSNTTLLLFLPQTGDFVPQSTLNLTLSQPGGAALNITPPSSLTVTVEASGAVSGVVNFQFVTPVSVKLEQASRINLLRTPPPWTSYMPALTVSWRASTIPAVSGEVVFAENATNAMISLVVPNDSVARLPYNALVSLLPTGGVTLGLQSSLSLLMPASNSPNGLFGFASLALSTSQGTNVSALIVSFALVALVACLPWLPWLPFLLFVCLSLAGAHDKNVLRACSQ